jgi:hypothetical protein
MSSLPFMRQRVPDELLSMNWTSLLWPSSMTVMARLICPESWYFTAWDTVGAAIAAAIAIVSIFLFILSSSCRQVVSPRPTRSGDALQAARR